MRLSTFIAELQDLLLKQGDKEVELQGDIESYNDDSIEGTFEVGGYANGGKKALILLVEKESRFETCSACSGSGYYDHNGSPPCGACNGKGQVKRR